MKLPMNVNQEEALYEFLDNVTESFELDDAIHYIRMIDPKRINRLAGEVEAFINFRNLAFPVGNRQWVSRRAFFGPLPFVISPTRLELVNGILIPGHRCVPFANSNLLPQEYSFYWQGQPVPFTTTEGSPEEFYPYYSIFGEEYAPQYVARDNEENEEAFNSDPYEDPPEVSIKTLDLRNIYREASFVPGDRFLVKTKDWKEGSFSLEKVGKIEWEDADLYAWFEAAEAGFEESFSKLGPGSCTEEQIAYAYWYGNSRMKEIPAYALEDFLYKRTGRIETSAYGIESRFWYAGREIPDLNELDAGNARPDKTPIEEILKKLKLPISEYVVQAYIRDSLYREEEDGRQITGRLIPSGTELDKRDKIFLEDYIESVLEDFREEYNPFTDKAMGSIRSRAGELHTAVIDLASRLNKGDIDRSWLPRHTFIILSQIQNHTASVLEDLDSDEALPEAELEAIDGSLDSMIETYEDIKELIDEALGSFRRNKLAVIHAGRNSDTVTERLLQLSIGGIDVWRRVIVNENCTLELLHHIIQTVFGWRNSQAYRFSADRTPGTCRRGSPEPRFPSGKDGNTVRPRLEIVSSDRRQTTHSETVIPFSEKELDIHTSIRNLDARNIIELIYEYGTKWNVRIMLLSKHDTPGDRPVRCIAGAGAAPPEFISGPLKFRRVLSALESGNDLERLGAREELGTEFNPGEFDLDSCNRNLNSNLLLKNSGLKR